MDGICKDCGSSYSLEDGETNFFSRMGLELPKRCHTCRAIRRGIQDIHLPCLRCGKRFLYPRELQLYARSYKWQPPETCIGGCKSLKFSPDYSPTDQEKSYIGLFGIVKLVKYLLGRDKIDTSFADAEFPTLFGFEKCINIKTSEIKDFLFNAFDHKLLNQISSIIYTGNYFSFDKGMGLVKEAGNTTFFLLKPNLKPQILVNRQHASKPDSLSEIKWTLCHEIGHVTYRLFLSDEEKADWHSLFIDQFEYFTLPGIKSEEEYFSECFAGYFIRHNAYCELSKTKRDFLENIIINIRAKS